MTNTDRTQWVSTVVRVVLAGIMLWAGLAKLLEPGQALRAVQAYRIFPSWIDDVVAIGLPIIEISVGLLLLLGLGTRFAAWVTAGLMVVFVAGVASAWIRGLSIDCGCFGGGGDVPSALAVWLIRFPTSRLSLDRLTGIAVEIGEDDNNPDEVDETP